MTMPFKVIVSPQAQRNAQDLYDWLSQHSREGANRWFDAFGSPLLGLADNPQGFGLAPESELHSEPVRQFLFKTPLGRTYRGLFLVRGDRVIVIHVRGPGQQEVSQEDL